MSYLMWWLLIVFALAATGFRECHASARSAGIARLQDSSGIAGMAQGRVLGGWPGSIPEMGNVVLVGNPSADRSRGRLRERLRERIQGLRGGPTGSDSSSFAPGLHPLPAQTGEVLPAPQESTDTRPLLNRLRRALRDLGISGGESDTYQRNPEWGWPGVSEYPWASPQPIMPQDAISLRPAAPGPWLKPMPDMDTSGAATGLPDRQSPGLSSSLPQGLPVSPSKPTLPLLMPPNAGTHSQQPAGDPELDGPTLADPTTGGKPTALVEPQGTNSQAPQDAGAKPTDPGSAGTLGSFFGGVARFLGSASKTDGANDSQKSEGIGQVKASAGGTPPSSPSVSGKGSTPPEQSEPAMHATPSTTTSKTTLEGIRNKILNRVPKGN